MVGLVLEVELNILEKDSGIGGTGGGIFVVEEEKDGDGSGMFVSDE